MRTQLGGKIFMHDTDSQVKPRRRFKLWSFVRRLPFLGPILAILVVLAVVFFVLPLVKNSSSNQQKTTKIGFENVGELATQSAYCTQVNVTEAAREIFGLEIPFTQSKYIYSYDVLIKAGYDFSAIHWEEKDQTIVVELPEPQILSTEIIDDSFQVYHEQESIFRQISLTENNEALQNMKENAQKDAIANGLLDNARDNAETILTGFFGNAYDLGTYQIQFVSSEDGENG